MWKMFEFHHLGFQCPRVRVDADRNQSKSHEMGLKHVAQETREIGMSSLRYTSILSLVVSAY